MTFTDKIRKTAQLFELHQLECSDFYQHAKDLLLNCLEISESTLWTRAEQKLTSLEIENIDAWITKRITGYPLQYIQGYSFFYESKFEVGPGCLIPRPETEILVDWILKQNYPSANYVELGAGSGNIGISVLLHQPHALWTAYEINPSSYSFAFRNSQKLLVESKYQLVQGDFFDAQGEYDFVISNPPYIPSNEIENLSREVQCEPKLALDGGYSGFEIIEKLISKASKLLKPSGFLAFEINELHYAHSFSFLKELNEWIDMDLIHDLSSKPRFIIARKK